MGKRLLDFNSEQIALLVLKVYTKWKVVIMGQKLFSSPTELLIFTSGLEIRLSS